MEGVIKVKEAPKVCSDNQIEASLHPLEEFIDDPKVSKDDNETEKESLEH